MLNVLNISYYRQSSVPRASAAMQSTNLRSELSEKLLFSSFFFKGICSDMCRLLLLSLFPGQYSITIICIAFALHCLPK